MDRVTLAGFGGTLATVSGSFHEVIGIVAGAMTVIYMAIKIFQEIKKK
jgi:threonine/homoserine/homoserine lactone efflux protein|tara:strand:+ start:137 stop:280 length:144 start_codon:yes stop_codon:yes gene_type:complete